jgi:hypothetical protein
MTPNPTPTNLENPVSGVGSFHAEKLSNLRSKLGNTVETVQFDEIPTDITTEQPIESLPQPLELKPLDPTFEPEEAETNKEFGSYFDNTPISFVGEESSFEPPVFSPKLPDQSQDILPKPEFSAPKIEVQPPIPFPHTQLPAMEQVQPTIEVPKETQKSEPQVLPAKIQEITPTISQEVAKQETPTILPVIAEKPLTLESIVTFLSLDKKSQVIKGAANFEREALNLK